MSRFDLVEWDGAWVVMASVDGLWQDEMNAYIECNNRNFGYKESTRRRFSPQPKFKVGQKVRLVRLIASDHLTSRDMLGFEGEVTEVEDLPNGEFNYDVDGRYLNEYMLELAPEPEPVKVEPRLREVDLDDPAL